MKKRSWWGRHRSIGLICTPFLWCGCGEPPAAPAPAPPRVVVATPVQRAVRDFDEFTGNTVAIESVEVRARVEGFLQSKEFVDSSNVEEGALLFVIDPAPFQARLDETRADLKSAEAELERAGADLERAQQALKTNAVSREEVSTRRANFAKAEAAVMSARASIAVAALNLGYTQVRSPIAGRVSRNLVDVGNLVGAGERTLLTTVVKMDPMYVYFEVPERTILDRLAERPVDDRRNPVSKVYIGLANEEGHPHEGRLDYLDNTVDASTGTVTVRGTVSNEEGLLFPGAFVRVRVPESVEEEAVLVNERAIGTDLGGKYLLLVGEENIVELRHIQLGPLFDGMRVVRGGIESQDRYILKGLQRARPGLPVTPEEEPAQPASPTERRDGAHGGKSVKEPASSSERGKAAHGSKSVTERSSSSKLRNAHGSRAQG